MELNLATIERIERFIVFEGNVELLHWEDTSQWGFKIKLGLLTRQDLDAFDKTMKRSKRRGGQRYHCILYGETNHQFEAQFAGRGWAETKGAHIALHIPDLDDQLMFREHRTRDQGESETPGRRYDLMLMEIGDDEILIDQTLRERAEAPVKGGPKSKNVAMLLQDQTFLQWLGKSVHWPAYGYDIDPNTKIADNVVKEVCGIKSKAEFDHDDEAWERFENQFHRPFIQWAQKTTRRV